MMPSNKELRKKIEAMDTPELYKMLQKVDPEYASELHPNNRPYLERALEIKLLTGKSKKDFRQEKVLKYDTLFLTPYDGERQKIYERINIRVEQMFED
jgi:tRNA dimethylallyltransferase